MRLNFFFDIDGTLLPFGKSIPDSALKAIQKAHALGHRIFLCTGRGTSEVDSRLHVLPLSGGVYSAGGTVIIGDETIYEKRLSKDEKEWLLSYCRENNLMTLVQSQEGTFLSPETFKCWKECMMKYIGRVLDIPGLMIVDEFPKDLVANKLLFFSFSKTVKEIRKDLDGRFVVVGNTVGMPEEMMAEIVLPELSKATGIERVLDYLGEGKESVVAIGDGANDIEMIEYAHLGIAMGNASEDLKRKADYITSDIEDDGIERAIDYAIASIG